VNTAGHQTASPPLTFVVIGHVDTVSMNQARTSNANFELAQQPCSEDDQRACGSSGGTWDPDTCTCHHWWEDPLVLNLDGQPGAGRRRTFGIRAKRGRQVLSDLTMLTLAGMLLLSLFQPNSHQQPMIVLNRTGNLGGRIVRLRPRRSTKRVMNRQRQRHVAVSSSKSLVLIPS
jgi:hypothetical protein